MRTVTLAASEEAEAVAGRQKLSRICSEQNGVWVSAHRLEKEGCLDTADLDFSPFYDEVHIRKLLPVVLVDSPIFHSLLNFIHFRELPHVGVEATYAHKWQYVYPLGNALAAIARVKKLCSKC
jgi:hypothetical protein